MTPTISAQPLAVRGEPPPEAEREPAGVAPAATAGLPIASSVLCCTLQKTEENTSPGDVPQPASQTQPQVTELVLESTPWPAQLQFVATRSARMVAAPSCAGMQCARLEAMHERRMQRQMRRCCCGGVLLPGREEPGVPPQR